MEKDRIIGQTKGVGFQIGVRRTFNVSIETAWDFLFSDKGSSIWLGKTSDENFELDKAYKTKEGIEGKVNTFKPLLTYSVDLKPKHWTNVSAVQIRVIYAKEKSTISFRQDKLLDSRQRQEMKIHWDKVIEKIENELTN